MRYEVGSDWGFYYVNCRHKDGSMYSSIIAPDQPTAEAAARLLNGEEEVEKPHEMLIGERDGLLWEKVRSLTDDQRWRIMEIANEGEKPEEPAASLQERMGLPWKIACAERGCLALITPGDRFLFASEFVAVLDIVDTVVGKILNEKGQCLGDLTTTLNELNALGRRLMERGYD